MSLTSAEHVAHRLHTNIAAAVEALQACAGLAGELTAAVDLLVGCLGQGGKLLTCGNGGSAADAAHLATEFVVRLQDERRPYPAICLNDSGATLTAMVNDYPADQIFARQVRAHARRGDVLLVISTSGKSPNILAAMQTARELDVPVIALLGRDGGLARALATVALVVPSQSTARIQEAHTLLYHCLCELTEERLPR